jgi:hypothetical protein
VLNNADKCLIYSCKRQYCEWFFQIDFGDANGSGVDFGTLDNGNSVETEYDGITVEGDVDWGITTVELLGETGSEVYCFSHRNIYFCYALIHCINTLRTGIFTSIFITNH